MRAAWCNVNKAHFELVETDSKEIAFVYGSSGAQRWRRTAEPGIGYIGQVNP
jgi:hypothetical protein